MKMYYYWCPTKPHLQGWFKDVNGLRAKHHKELTPSDKIIRAAHCGINPPEGWRKTSGELAFDPIERIPTMRDFIHAMTK